MDDPGRAEELREAVWNDVRVRRHHVHRFRTSPSGSTDCHFRPQPGSQGNVRRTVEVT